MTLKSRKLRHTLAAGSIAALAALSLAACSGGDGGTDGADAGGDGGECTPAYEFETVTPGELTVATYDYPPLSLIDGEKMTGVEGDLLTEIAARQCLDLTVVSAGGAGAAIPSVETGRADLAAGDWYRTSARAEIVHLSEPVYLDGSGIVSTQGLTTEDIENPDYIIASVSGNLWNDSVQKLIGDNFKVYQDDPSIYADLAAGRIDAIIASVASSQTTLDANPIEGAEIIPLEPLDGVPEFEKPGQAGWPTNYDNEALSEGLDKLIVDLRDEGVIADTLEKYGLSRDLADTGEPYEL